MKCMNCNAEISPQYVHAIANNICPGCGGSIYDEPTKELYNELKEAMLRMPNDPVGVAGWLLDNYKLHKIGTAEPVSRFYNANPKEPEPQEKVKSASSEKTKDFFQRAGVSPQTKRNLSKNYSSLVEQINNNINEMYGEEDEVDMGSEFSPEDDLIAARSMNAKFAEEEIILPGKPLARHEVNELKALLSKNSSTSDVILENERLEKLQRQENMLSGGGGFKRS